jgi:hypothetical protein
MCYNLLYYFSKFKSLEYFHLRKAIMYNLLEVLLTIILLWKVRKKTGVCAREIAYRMLCTITTHWKIGNIQIMCF